MSLEVWLIQALVIAAVTALVIVVVHFAGWDKQIGAGYDRPINYVVGNSILTAGFGVWCALNGAWIAFVAWCLILGIPGAADIAAWRYHALRARRAPTTLRKLAPGVPDAPTPPRPGAD